MANEDWSALGTPVVDAPAEDWSALGTPVKDPKQNTSLAGDIGTGMKRGVLQMPGMVTGLADLATTPIALATGVNRPISKAADWAGEKTGFQPEKWAKNAEAEYSPEMQQAQANVEAAQGFFPTLGAVAENPRVAAQLVAESLPSTLAGGVLARGAMGMVTGAGKLAALRAAAGSADAVVANAAKAQLLKAGAIAAGIGEGAVTAGQQMSQTGYEVDPALAAGTALAAGVGTGLIGAGSGRLANSAVGKRLGLSDIETSMAAGTLGENAGKAGLASYAKRIGAGTIQEGLLEEAPQSYQEQVWQNLASGKPWDEGAASAAAQGAIAGGLMGGTVNAIPRKPEVAPPPAPAIPDPSTGGTFTPDPNGGVLERGLSAMANARAEVDSGAARNIDTIDRGLDLVAPPTAPSTIPDNELPIVGQPDAAAATDDFNFKDTASGQNVSTDNLLWIDAQSAADMLLQQDDATQGEAIYSLAMRNEQHANDIINAMQYQRAQRHAVAQRTAAAADKSGAVIPDAVREVAETRPQIPDVKVPVETQNTKAAPEANNGPARRVDMALPPAVTQQQLADQEANRSTPRASEQLFTEDAPVSPAVQPTQGAADAVSNQTAETVPQQAKQQAQTVADSGAGEVRANDPPGNATPAKGELDTGTPGSKPVPVARPAALPNHPAAKILAKALPEAKDVQIHSTDSLSSEKESGATGRMSKWRGKTIERMARVFGNRKVVFFSSSSPAGSTTNGMTYGADGVLYINIDAGVDPIAVVGHEWRHALRYSNAAAHAAINQAATKLLDSPGRLLEFAKVYHGVELAQDDGGSKDTKDLMARIEAGEATDEDKARLAEEFSADITGNLWRDPKALREVFDTILEQHPPSAARTIIKSIGDAILKLIDKLIISTPKGKYSEMGISRDELLGLKKEIQAAMADSFKQDVQRRLDKVRAGQGGEVKFATARKPGSYIGHKRENESGRYVGAPDWVGNAVGQIAVLRKKLRGLAKDGEPGRFWYENSSKAILELVNGDKNEAEKLVQLIAIYSPSNAVPGNTTMAVKAYYQWKQGLPIRVGTGNNDSKANDLLYEGREWGGIKTNSFYQNLMQEIDPSKNDTGAATMDMWMALAFDYGMKVVDQGPKYRFMEREIQRLARELGWTPHQVQAAIWTGMKGRIDPIRGALTAAELDNGWHNTEVTAAWNAGEKAAFATRQAAYEKAKAAGKKVSPPVLKLAGIDTLNSDRKKDHYKLAHKMGMAHNLRREDVEASKYDFSDAIKERTAQMSWEATPGASTGVLPGIHDAPMSQQQEYLAAQRAAFTDDKGNDIIGKEIGIAMAKSVQGFSGWKGISSVGVQDGMVIPPNSQEGGLVHPVASNAIDLFAAVRGLVLAQEGVAWHYPIYTGSKNALNGVQFDIGRLLTEEESANLYKALSEELGHTFSPPIATQDGLGFRVLNFPDEKFALKDDFSDKADLLGQTGVQRKTKLQKSQLEKNKEFRDAVYRAVERQAWKELTVGNVSRFESDGNLVENDWSNGDGDYRERIREATEGFGARSWAGRSDIFEWIDRDLRPKAEAVNKEFADKYGWGKQQALFSPARSDAAGSPGTRGGPGQVDEGTRPGSVSGTGVHYSKQQRSTLDSSFFGTGLKGDELPRVTEATDPRLKHRIYFYLNTGKGIKPEAGVGIHAHQADLSNIYDATNDTRDLVAKYAGKKNEFESALLDSGYDGYMTQSSGVAILLGERSQPVEYLGTNDRPDVAQAGTAEKSDFGKLQRSVVDNKALPSGEMTGADWKRMLPKLMPEIDVSHLADDQRYYKDGLVKRPEVKRSTARAMPAWWNEPSTNAFAKGMTQGDVIQDALDRYVKSGALKKIGEQYEFYHATPNKTLTELRAGTLLEYNPEDAKFFARRDRGLGKRAVTAIRLQLYPEQLNPPSGTWFSLRDDTPIDGAAKFSPARAQTETPEFKKLSDLLGPSGVSGGMVSSSYKPIGKAKEIEVDGVMRSTLNSNGKPIHPTEEGVRNFWRWFSPSPGQLIDGLSVAEVSSLKRDTEAISDFIESQSGLPEPDRFKVIPSSVFAHVSGAVDDTKILDAVVRSLPVDVMDFFAGKKFSAEQFLHDAAMLEDVFSINPASDVTLAVNPSRIAELTVRVVANAGAKISGLANGALKRNAAVLADANDPVLGAHVRKSSGGNLGIIAGFGDSKVVDAEGKPLVVYHSTNADWSEFDPMQTLSSFGFHAGTKEQAEAVRGTGGTKADVTAVRPSEGLNVMPVYLALQNPLRMEDKGTWYSHQMIEDLAQKGIKDESPLPENARDLAGYGAGHMSVAWDRASEARKRWDLAVKTRMKTWRAEHPDAGREAYDDEARVTGRNYVRDLLAKNGYDGIVYDNKFEGKGDSYIAFEPTQIKSATGNNGQFDGENPDIRFSPSRAQVETPEFKKWFGDSVVTEDGNPGGVPVVATHMTNTPWTVYDKSKTKDSAVWGRGLYLSLGKKWEGAAKNEMRLYVRSSNPLDLTGPLSEKALEMLSAYAGRKVDAAPLLTMEKRSGSITQGAQDAGFDSIIHFGPGSTGKHITVFEPTQIKSATDNNSQFDPTNPDIRRSTPRGAITNQPINQAWQDPDNLGKWDTFVRTMADKMWDTKKVLSAIRAAGIAIKDTIDPYLQEVLYHGRAAKRVSDFADSELRPMLVEMGMRKIERQELEDYLWARHATERNAQIAKINPKMPDGGSGLTNQQAADILAGQTVTVGKTATDPGRDIKLTISKMPGYRSLAAKVDAITKETTDTLVRYGLETQDTVDSWRATYGKYVPLMRDMEADDNYAGAFNLGLGTGQGFSVRGSASKRALGSERGVIDILANVAMQRERAIVRGEKNRVAQSMYGLAITAPNPDFWLPLNPDANKDPAQVTAELVAFGLNPIDAANIANEPKQRYTDPNTGMVMERINPQLRSRGDVLAVRINGKDRYVMFSSNERAQKMVAGLKNMDVDQLGMVMQKMAVVTRWFAAINTQYNPVFGLTNGIRDLGTGMLNLTSTELKGRQAEVFKNAFSALRGVYADLRDHRAGRTPTSRWALEFEEFALEGGQTGYRDMFQTSRDRTEGLMQELKDATKGKTLLTFSEKRSPLFGWLSDYNTAIENAIRLSAYKAAKDKGMTKAQAASLAKNLTVNFNKKGLAATQLGAMYAFFNAAAQGTARIGQTLVKVDNGKFSLTGAGKKIVYGGMMAGVLQAAMFAAAGYDDEEPPQFIREKNFIIPDFVFGSGKYLSIPYPLGFHVIPNIGRVSAEFALGGFKNPGKRLVDMFSMIMDGFNPIGGSSGGVSQMLSPTVTDPLVALSENKDWTGKSIYKEDFNSMHPTAGWTRKKDTASDLSRWMAYGINYLTGGGKYEIGLLSPTPDQLDFLIGQGTGGVGRESLKAWQFGSTVATGENMPMYKVPIAGRFVGETTGQASETSKFYNNLKRIGEHKAALDEMQKAHDLSAMIEYRKDNPDAALVKQADKASTDISDLKRRKRELLEKGASPEQIRMMEEMITTRVRSYNDRLSARG